MPKEHSMSLKHPARALASNMHPSLATAPARRLHETHKAAIPTSTAACGHHRPRGVGALGRPVWHHPAPPSALPIIQVLDGLEHVGVVQALQQAVQCGCSGSAMQRACERHLESKTSSSDNRQGIALSSEGPSIAQHSGAQKGHAGLRFCLCWFRFLKKMMLYDEAREYFSRKAW